MKWTGNNKDRKHTEEPWVFGFGDGVTGPTTPAIGGITVHESIAYSRWKSGMDKGLPEEHNPYPHRMYTVISKGKDVVAILPTLNIINLPDGNENGVRIVECVNAMEGIKRPSVFKKILRVVSLYDEGKLHPDEAMNDICGFLAEDQEDGGGEDEHV